MEKEFVSYEQAVALKELGFGGAALGGFQQGSVFYFENGKLYYDGHPMYSSNYHEGIIIAPLKQQVFRWFREKYEWYSNLSTWIHEDEIGIYHEFEIYGNENGVYYFSYFKTYEEAENACIDKLIELAKVQIS
jgi:hypothetical protein